MTGKYTAPKTIPHVFGFRPGTNLDKLNELADELESEAYTTGQRPRDDSARPRPPSSDE
jgi:hypothetical protein